jgi:hypothetical protein
MGTIERQKSMGGCEFFRNCFRCPFPTCAEEVGGKAKARTFLLRARAVKMHKHGMSVEQIAGELSRSKRTIYRLLASE